MKGNRIAIRQELRTLRPLHSFRASKSIARWFYAAQKSRSMYFESMKFRNIWLGAEGCEQRGTEDVKKVIMYQFYYGLTSTPRFKGLPFSCVVIKSKSCIHSNWNV